MNSKTVMDAVTDSLARIRRHPFIVDAQAGRLTSAQATRWIFCAGRESRSFPAIIEQMLARCSDPRVAAVLSDNLNDEHGNGNPEHAHFRHYLHLIDQLGLSRSMFHDYRERAGIKLALDLAHSVSRQPKLPLAIGYMLVNEGMTAITYAAMRTALLRHHPALSTRFFDLHIAVDDKHVDDLYRAVEALPAEAEAEIVLGVCIGERGMAVLLDEAFGLFDSCDDTRIYEPAA